LFWTSKRVVFKIKKACFEVEKGLFSKHPQKTPQKADEKTPEKDCEKKEKKGEILRKEEKNKYFKIKELLEKKCKEMGAI
jgi:hypothetical protein